MSGEWATGEENGEQNAAGEDFREAWMEGNMESRGVERRWEGLAESNVDFRMQRNGADGWSKQGQKE